MVLVWALTPAFSCLNASVCRKTLIVHDVFCITGTCWFSVVADKLIKTHSSWQSIAKIDLKGCEKKNRYAGTPSQKNIHTYVTESKQQQILWRLLWKVITCNVVWNIVSWWQQVEKRQKWQIEEGTHTQTILNGTFYYHLTVWSEVFIGRPLDSFYDCHIQIIAPVGGKSYCLLHRWRTYELGFGLSCVFHVGFDVARICDGRPHSRWSLL